LRLARRDLAEISSFAVNHNHSEVAVYDHDAAL